MADIDTNTEIEEALNTAVNTVHKPGKLATGDAVAIYIDKVKKIRPAITTDDVIRQLQEAGFANAEVLRDFISAKIASR